MKLRKDNVNLYNEFLKCSYSELKELFNEEKTKEEQDFYINIAIIARKNGGDFM